MVALLVLMASAAHASLEEGPLALRRSQGRGRDNPKCIEPPPPLRGDLSAQRKSGEAAPSHLKYLALDGSTDTAESDWTNLGFIGPTPAGNVNQTELQTYLDLGYDMFLSMQGITVQTCIWGTNAEVVHSVASTPPSPFKSTERRPATAHSPLCPERWQAAWTGPNATIGGIWNNSIEKLAKEKKLIGVYLGDELLGGGLTVSNLTAITKMVKAVWPEGIVYYNEEWTPFNDPDWKDSEGQPYGKVPPTLDWISYDFYRLNNVSWLQPMCEYHQNLYPRFSSPHQRALLLPGGWGSTSGPRGGAGQFKYNCSACPGTPQCTVEISMSCTSDPFSCSNLNETQGDGPGTANQSGLVWEVEKVLTGIGDRPCWNFSQYDDFNVLNAQAYYDWAVNDPKIVGINIWPWSGWMPVRSYQGVNMGLQLLPKATAAWKDIGKKIKAGQAATRAE